MKQLFILAIILFITSLNGSKAKAQSLKFEDEIIALERSALDKWAQSNATGYIDIAADEVSWFDFNPGEQLRIDSIGAVRIFLSHFTGQIPPHTYELVDTKVQVYENTAILTFHWKAKMADGTPLGKWKATSVYHGKKGKWYHVHGHWSPVQNE